MSDRAEIKLALDTLDAVLNRRLIDQSHLEGKPDLRSRDGEPTIAAEVKRLTSSEFRRRNAQLSDLPFLRSSVLHRRWKVTVEVPTLADELSPAHAPGSSLEPALNKQLKDAGFEVYESPSQPTSPPKLYLGKHFLRHLERILLVIEESGVELTRGGLRHLKTSHLVEGGAALREFERRTNGGIGQATASSQTFPSGIEVLSSSAYVRTRRPDVLANRINVFLASARKDAKRLRKQLGSVPATGERHAFLVFDSTEPEFLSWSEWDLDDIPDVPLDLPAMIDRLWLRPADGKRVWCFDVAHGWQAHQIA